MIQKPYIILIVLLFGLTACGPTTPTKPDPAKSEQLESTALNLITTGDYNGAAAEYLSLADKYPSLTVPFRLKAATAYYEGGELDSAEQVLTQTDINKQVSPTEATQKNIILARIAIEKQQYEQAVAFLEDPLGENTTTSIKIAYYETRAQALDNLQRTEESVLNRLEAYAISDENNVANIDYNKLWEQLNKFSITKLDTLNNTAPISSQSWLKLALITKSNLTNPTALNSEIVNWLSQFPGHIANINIIPDILSSSQQLYSEPETIALLLPLSGKFQQASNAVREGFLSAWLEEKNYQPKILFFDTSQNDVLQVYQRAIEEGANFVVGPLQKDNVIKLFNNADFPVNTLALNYINGKQDIETENPANTFFQYGLSPEQEASQIAQKIYQNGLKKALVITPKTDWGDRLITAFVNEYQELGGEVLENSGFDPLEKDYDNAVKALLNTDSSKLRSDRLVDVLRLKIESETRRRQDADVIFLATTHQHAKLIIPHFYFERARDIPIYATSNIHIQTTNNEDYIDMNGVLFPDIPWLLDPNTLFSFKRSTFDRHWPNASATNHRLFAMGHDAYSIISKFRQLVSENLIINGASGYLSMNNQGQIIRKLQWGKIVDGSTVSENEVQF